MKKGVSKSSLIAMGGITMSLLSLVIIFSQNTIFSFLTIGIVAPFGFIGFWILLPFVFIVGLYMLLQQKLMKFKVGLSLWGLLIIIFSLLILSSVWCEQTLVPNGDLNFGTVSPTYTSALSEINSNPYDARNGGGFIGYFLTGCLFSAVTKIGTQIICWLLIAIGLCLVFNRQIKRLYLFMKNRKERKARKIAEEPVFIEESDSLEEIPYEEEEEPKPTPIEKPIQAEEKSFYSQPSFYNNEVNDSPINSIPNSSKGIKKAQFSLGGEDDSLSSQSFGLASFTEPTFDNNEHSFDSEYDELASQSQEDDNLYVDERPFEEEPTIASKPAFSMNNAPAQKAVEPAPAVQAQPEPVVDKLHRPQPKASSIKNYIYPPIDLLDFHEKSDDAEVNSASTQETIDKINEIFTNLRIGAKVVGSTVGPCVTRYDVETNSDVSVNSVTKYIEDISIKLGGVPCRFEKIVYGKATSGLEIPNAVRTNVGLRESISKLPEGPKFLRYIPFGKNIAGELLSANLSDFPHMLVSGTTGSGKTIFMHSVILSLIMRNKPDELKLILIDPKKVEMAYYEKIPHLLCPNISQSQKAYVAMKKLVDEMERRYNLFADNRVRDIKGFNEFAKANGIQPLPYIVVFIDEYADLVEEVKDIKGPVVRIAQKARAAGIHLVIATQRPSVNVIDGVIKANVSVRVALMVASQVDSISIINQAGAESLLGNGDMIVECSLINRSGKPRVQGCFVDVPEINRVCDFLRSHYSEQYDPEFLDLEEHDEIKEVDADPSVVVDKDMAEEQLYELIKEQIVERDYCSISFIQRTYGVGFPKAGRLFNKLIQDGYVARGGDARGSKVLIRNKQEQQIGTIEQSTFIPDPEPGNNDLN